MAALEDEVFGKIGQLNLDELLNIHGDLGLPEIVDDAHRTQQRVRRAIMRFLTSDEVVNSDDQGGAHYLRIKTFMDTQDIIVTRTNTLDQQVPPVADGVVPPVADGVPAV